MTRRTVAIAYPERDIARETGSPTYVTGRPCKWGHLAPRFTVDASCTECRRRFKEAYREEAREYAKRRRNEALARDLEGTREKWRADSLAQRRRDPERARKWSREGSRRKRERYPQRKLAETRARQLAKLQRTPPWADLRAIRDFYENCPPGMEVDHIVPLRGKSVSGLHVLGNLQYLTPQQNREKGNRFTDDWESES